MRRLLFDIEGNGLLPEITKVHCICAVDVDSGETFEWGPKEIPAALKVLGSADLLIAHNGIDYDYLVLEKLYGFTVPDAKAWDSLILSRLIRPNVRDTDAQSNRTRKAKGEPLLGDDFGSHSISAWGVRLGCHKLYQDIEDWSIWTPEIQERCAGDVQTALRLWKYLKPDTFSKEAIELEHRVARVCRKITQTGWPFDVEAAVNLQIKLVEEAERLETELKAEFPGWTDTITEKKPFVPKRDDAKRGYVKGVPIYRKKTKFIEFNPRSRDQIARRLKDMGWKPVEFTDTGKPKMDEEVLESLVAEYPEAANIARYWMLGKRIGQISDGQYAWLKMVQDDGCIHTQYNTMGAVTSRAAHYNPNIAQVPAVGNPYGAECRSLFTVPDGWEIVGADQESLEGRCFAHYLAKYDEGRYGETLLSGDPHWGVVKAVGYLDCERDKANKLHTIIREQGAKRLFYGMLYGSGDEKAGRIVLEALRLARKEVPDQGGKIYTAFFQDDAAPGRRKLKSVGRDAKERVIVGIEGFPELKATIDHYHDDRGWIWGLDKRTVPLRSKHSALNTLLQSAGAIICKRWLADAYDALIAEGFEYGWNGDFVILGWIHDELQVACRNGLGDRIGRVLTSTAQKAGEPYGFRIKLDSKYKVGKTWADTH